MVGGGKKKQRHKKKKRMKNKEKEGGKSEGNANTECAGFDTERRCHG